MIAIHMSHMPGFFPPGNTRRAVEIGEKYFKDIALDKQNLLGSPKHINEILNIIPDSDVCESMSGG